MYGKLQKKDVTTKRRLKKVKRTGKKLPLTEKTLEQLHDIKLELNKLQRIARSYYKTQKIGDNLLFIHSPLLDLETKNPLRSVSLDFSTYDNDGYILVKPLTKGVNHAYLKATTTKGLLVKLFRLQFI